MRKVVWLICLAVLLTGGLAAKAAEPAKVVVFPFDVFAKEQLGYLKNGLADMLNSRLATEGVTTVERAKVEAELKKLKKPLDLTAARNIASDLGAQFAVYGSFTKIGSRVSMDAKVLDASGLGRPQSVFVEGAGLDALPGLSDKLARELASRMSGRQRVAAINVSGNRRIETAAIKNVLKTKEGSYFSPQVLDGDLKALWKMGYFANVRVEAGDGPKGKVVTIVVAEKPSVREIVIVGNKALESKDLKDQIGIKAFKVYQPEAVAKAKAKIIELYNDKGFYDVKVDSKVSELPSGDMSLRFRITEGKKVLISKIQFQGNKAFTDSKLRSEMSTSEKGWLSWLTESGVLEGAKLKQDLQKISEHYYNNGYMNAKVGSPKISKQGEGLVVTINIIEGPKYKIGKLDVTGDLLKPKKEILAGMETKPGQTFKRDNLRADLMALTEMYSEKGYAYVDVRPRLDRNNQKNTVDIVFNVTKGNKTYIERIIIIGNDRTRDKVIRRELGLVEGDLFSGKALKNGNIRLHRLAYFEDVHISQLKGSDPNQMVVQVKVKEKRTGQFAIGAGYSSVDSFMVVGQVQERNLFGRGQSLALRAQLGGKSTRYTVSFTEPWLFDRPVSFGVDLFNWEREYSTYDKESIGGRLRFGFPTGFAYTRVYTYLTYEDVTVKNIDDGAATVIKDQEGQATTISLKGILRRDSRDHPFNTTTGSDHSVSLEWAGGPLGGDNSFIKAIADTGWYFPLFWKTVFVTHGRIGWVRENPGGKLPIYEKFFLGGINSLRGFSYYKVSPKDPATGDEIGGERMLQFNFEYRFPVVTKAGVVGLIFFDMGNVWTEDEGYRMGDLRKTVGLGIRWYSPMGPLRLEYGYVLDRRQGEDDSNWEFTVGSLF